MGKVPNPCIDVCKYKIKGGHCIGCGMTKPQKKEFKGLDGGKEKRGFLYRLTMQQARLPANFKGWQIAYRRKCQKKGVDCPLDELEGAG
jgi:predicted Fe-S protein YdhL (DUF1289 family)